MKFEIIFLTKNINGNNMARRFFLFQIEYSFCSDIFNQQHNHNPIFARTIHFIRVYNGVGFINLKAFSKKNSLNLSTTEYLKHKYIGFFPQFSLLFPLSSFPALNNILTRLRRVLHLHTSHKEAH